MATPEQKRIFFGSLELEEKQRIDKGIDDNKIGVNEGGLTLDTLPFSEKTQESIEKQKKIIKELEEKKRLREIPVPTNDDDVKARLIELSEPIILFGESKPDRRERLRRIMAERGITQPMPSTTRARAPLVVESDIPQEPFSFVGDYPKELKEARLQLLKSSLYSAKERLSYQKKRVEEIDTNWDVYEKEFKSFETKLAKYTEISSQVGDSRALSACSFSPDGNHLATSSWGGLCKIWEIPSSNCKTVLEGHTERANDIKFYHKASSPSTVNLASCGADSKVLLWSLTSNRPLRELKGHVDRVNRVVFHPSGTWIASTSFDKTWSLWDIETEVS